MTWWRTISTSGLLVLWVIFAPGDGALGQQAQQAEPSLCRRGTTPLPLLWESCVDMVRAGTADRRAVAFAYWAQGDSVWRRFQKGEAAKAYFAKAIELDPELTEAYLSRGLMTISIPAALADLSKAITLDPRSVAAYDRRADLYKTLKMYNEAIADLTTLIELEPLFAEQHLARRAAFRHEYGDTTGEISDYSRRIELHPDRGEFYADRAAALLRASAFDEAIADYSKAIAMGRNEYMQRAMAHDAKGDIAHAIEDYKKTLEWSVLDPRGYNNLARDLVKVGQLSEAELVIGKLIELRYASGFATRALVYEAMGRRDDAISDLRQALSMEPYLTEASEALRRIGASP